MYGLKMADCEVVKGAQSGYIAKCRGIAPGARNYEQWVATEFSVFEMPMIRGILIVALGWGPRHPGHWMTDVVPGKGAARVARID